MRRVTAVLIACWCALASTLALAGTVVTGELRGGIGPASAAHLERVLQEGQRLGAELVVVSLDTPGGLDTAMRTMIQAILASPVPVALFVAPRGARAASAGTYLLYASHIAAMAPGTNVGAATPVAIGMGGARDRADGEERDDATPDKSAAKDRNGKSARRPQSRDPMESKAVHDAVAYLKSLAELRGRNREWAEKAVIDADSVAANEALKLGVIDVVAVDVPDLLRQLDGRSVEVPSGTRRLALAGASLHVVVPNWKERVLATIADPNIALLLLVAGAYGLLIEFYTPGTAVPGVLGAVALLLGLYGLALLPINLAGAALIALGLALMVAEAFVASFGALGIGGVVAFVAGGLLLIDAEIPGFTVSWGMILPLAIGNALAIVGIAALAMRARHRPSVAGAEGMIGATVEALEDIEREGWVRAHGERWHARTRVPLRAGDRARIEAIDGLVLVVAPVDQPGGSS